MPQEYCPQGHLYDSTEHITCPYCPVSGLDSVEPEGGGEDRYDDWRVKATAEPYTSGGTTEPWYQNDEGRTIAWWQHKTDGKRGINPVVGWLVAIAGPDKGKAFRLHPEGNTVGRGHKSNVMLSDPTVASEEHANVFFDPAAELEQLTKAYTLIPSSRRGVYLNKTLALAPEVLSSYDVVRIGDSELLFVALCNERFAWDWKSQSEGTD